MTRLFDCLNSRAFGKGGKSPLRPQNKFYWKPIFDYANYYIRNLRRLDGVRLLDTDCKTAFKGLLITIESLEAIMVEIENGTLELEYVF